MSDAIRVRAVWSLKKTCVFRSKVAADYPPPPTSRPGTKSKISTETAAVEFCLPSPSGETSGAYTAGPVTSRVHKIAWTGHNSAQTSVCNVPWILSI